AMGRQEYLVVALQEALHRGEKLRHVALWRRDHRRIPTHDVIAGEHSALADQREAKMIRRMSRRVQHVDRVAAALHYLGVFDRPIGHERLIDEPAPKARSTRAARGLGGTEAQDLAAEGLLKCACAVAMVAMAVRYEDVADTLALGRICDCPDVPLIIGSRIDDSDISAAYEIGVGAEERVRRGIVGDDATNSRRHLFGDPVMHVNAAIEGKLRRHLVLGFKGSGDSAILPLAGK